MAKIKSDVKEDIFHYAGKWLNIDLYKQIKNITSEHLLNHYEMRSIVYDVFSNGDEGIKSLFKKESTISSFYKYIISNEIFDSQPSILKKKLQHLRRASDLEYRTETNFSLKSLTPLTWL